MTFCLNFYQSCQRGNVFGVVSIQQDKSSINLNPADCTFIFSILIIVLIVEEFFISLEDDVTAVPPTRLNVVVNRAGGRVEFSVGCQG